MALIAGKGNKRRYILEVIKSTQAPLRRGNSQVLRKSSHSEGSGNQKRIPEPQINRRMLQRSLK